MTIEVRFYRPGDEVQILELFKQTYNRELSMSFWNWRFAHNPFDKPQILMAFDNEKLVGHYAISAVKASLAGTESLIAHSMTTMTHPDYQGRGFFTNLASGLYEQLQSNGYAGVWGFPNNNSFYGFVKNLKWKPILEIPFLHCEEPNIKAPPLTAYSDLDLDFDNNYINKINSKTQIIRSPRYLNWRYKQNPSVKYEFMRLELNNEFLGYIIYKPYQTENSATVDLLETQAKDPQSLGMILEWARYYFLHEKKINMLTAWCNIHSDEYLFFLKSRFKPTGKTTYMAGTNFSKNEASGNWLDPRDWNISMGDSDVF